MEAGGRAAGLGAGSMGGGGVRVSTGGGAVSVDAAGRAGAGAERAGAGAGAAGVTRKASDDAGAGAGAGARAGVAGGAGFAAATRGFASAAGGFGDVRAGAVAGGAAVVVGAGSAGGVVRWPGSWKSRSCGGPIVFVSCAAAPEAPSRVTNEAKATARRLRRRGLAMSKRKFPYPAGLLRAAAPASPAHEAGTVAARGGASGIVCALGVTHYAAAIAWDFHQREASGGEPG